MKTAETIIAVLANGSATTSILAGELSQPERVILAFCEDLELTGAITRQELTPKVIVWSLIPQPAAV